MNFRKIISGAFSFLVGVFLFIFSFATDAFFHKGFFVLFSFILFSACFIISGFCLIKEEIFKKIKN